MSSLLSSSVSIEISEDAVPESGGSGTKSKSSFSGFRLNASDTSAQPSSSSAVSTAQRTHRQPVGRSEVDVSFSGTSRSLSRPLSGNHIQKRRPTVREPPTPAQDTQEQLQQQQTQQRGHKQQLQQLQQQPLQQQPQLQQPQLQQPQQQPPQQRQLQQQQEQVQQQQLPQEQWKQQRPNQQHAQGEQSQEQQLEQRQRPYVAAQSSSEFRHAYAEQAASESASKERRRNLVHGEAPAPTRNHAQPHQQQQQPPAQRGRDRYGAQLSQSSPLESLSPRERRDDGRYCIRERASYPLDSARAYSFKTANSAAPARLLTGGHPCEGILKHRSENWMDLSAMDEELGVTGRDKRWLVPGSVLWRLSCAALALRFASSLALLMVVFTTLGWLGKSVSCADMSHCVGVGGVMAYPTLLRTTPNFGAGIVAYETITGSLVAGLVLMLLPLAGSCYFTCQALLKGTKKAYLEDVRITTCCTAWIGACVGIFIPPFFSTKQFCNLTNFDVNSAYRSEGSPVPAVSSNICDQLRLVEVCVAVAALCVCCTGLLVFQRYSRFWGTLLGLGCLKCMLSGFLLCITITVVRESSEMILEIMNSEKQGVGLQAPMVDQLNLLCSSLTWGGCILALSNMACGALTVWAAHLRSHLLSCTNLVCNFVFFFVNAVSFCAMLFEKATFTVVCDYTLYPMVQSERARAEAAALCTIKPQFTFAWFLVALLALMHLCAFIVSAFLFQREFCRSKPKTGALISAPSIDSLPPKWGVRR